MSAGKQRPFVVPFEKGGVPQEKLRLPSPALWEKIYATVYEIGKYMLETYGVFEG